jgi:hypothetical protein
MNQRFAYHTEVNILKSFILKCRNFCDACAAKVAGFFGYLIGMLLSSVINKDSGLCRQDLFICASSIHILQCISRDYYRPSHSYFFYGKGTNLKNLFLQLHIKNKIINASDLIKAILLVIWHRKSLRVWVPHLSEYILPCFCLSLLTELDNKNFIYYYDDGTSAFTKSNLINVECLLPKNASISSWNYIFIGKKGFPQGIEKVSHFDRALLLLDHNPSLGSYSFVRQHQSENSASIYEGDCQVALTPPSKKILVMASKSLDNSELLRCLSFQDLSHAIYIPHYRKSKNHALFNSLSIFMHSGFLEFSLYSLCKSDSVEIYHGITSTVLILTELLLRCPLPVNVVFIFMPTRLLETETRKQELSDYVQVLQYYKYSRLVQEKGITYIM